MTSGTVGCQASPRGKAGVVQKCRVVINSNYRGAEICDASTNKTGDSSGGSSPKPRINRTSPTIFGHYAGPKFSEPPEAALLPPPPPRWTFQSCGPESFDHASHQLKLLLNVRA